MWTSVALHPLARVDDQQRCFSAGRAGDHVLEEFEVTRCIDDDVRASRGLEKDARRFDGDALPLLLLQRVDKERIFEWLAIAFARRAHVIEFSLWTRSRIGEQAPDDGAFPVIDMPNNGDVHARCLIECLNRWASLPASRRSLRHRDTAGRDSIYYLE